MASKIKPGAKHPTKPGMVMGTKGRYVSTSTYRKQKGAGTKPDAKPTNNTPKSTSPSSTAGSRARSSRQVGRSAALRKDQLQAKQNKPGVRRREAARRLNQAKSNQATPKTTPKATPKANLGQRLSNAAKNVKLPQVKLPPGASKILGAAGRVAGGVPLALAGIDIAKDLKESIFDRKEGFGSIPRHLREMAEGGNIKNSRSGRGAGRASFEVKKSSNSKSSSDKPNTKPKYPTTAVTKTVKKGRDYQAEAKARAEAARKTAGPKPKRKPSIKEAAYAKDSRNREYDRLRKAGKTKEAEKLGREIAGMKPKKAKETQKRTGGSRIANITLPKKPKKQQSAANRAGYPGNRNY